MSDTIVSRSIPIEMRRKLPSETVSRFLRREVKESAVSIRAELETWAEHAVAVLQKIAPALIESLGDRQNDIVEPLLAIAELAGAEPLHNLTGALETVFGSSVAEDTSNGVILLRDVRSIFTEHSTDRMASKQLAELLCGIVG